MNGDVEHTVIDINEDDLKNHQNDTDLSTTRMAEIIGRLRAAGVPVVAAAGNFDRKFSPAGAEPRPGMGSPAILRSAISVEQCAGSQQSSASRKAR